MEIVISIKYVLNTQRECFLLESHSVLEPRSLSSLLGCRCSQIGKPCGCELYVHDLNGLSASGEDVSARMLEWLHSMCSGYASWPVKSVLRPKSMCSVAVDVPAVRNMHSAAEPVLSRQKAKADSRKARMQVYDLHGDG